MPKQQLTLHDRILDKALEQAEALSWEQLHLHAVAEALNITLDEIRQYFPQKDDLVEAWFDRADRALLSAAHSEDFLDLPLYERLQQVIASWLDALAPHRRLTREMLAYKFEFGHLHLQALGVMRISRTVQWFIEAARHDTTGLQRIIDECALTTIYLTTFACWLFDDSVNRRKSKDALDTALRRWLRIRGNRSKPPIEQEKTEQAQHQPGH
ncbi:MAG: TetR/AcrR family transcriptional regulator [Pseudomonadota bacterium]